MNRHPILLAGLVLIVCACGDATRQVAPADTASVTFPPLAGQIAFTSTRDGSPYIYVAAADGSSLRRLAKGESPSWSWDGRQIVFRGVDYAGDSSVHVINSDGSGERVLQLGGVFPDVSPDGSRIAFSTDSGMYVANSDGSNATLLVRSDWQRPGDIVNDAGWSPDGKHIAFFSGDDDDFGFGLYVANVDGSGIFATRLNASGPARWSPDGSMIAFGTTVFDNPAGTVSNSATSRDAFVVARPDGSALRVVGFSGDNADWSPDGRVLVVSPTPGHRIFVTDTTFQVLRRLVPDAVSPAHQPYDDYDPVWSRVVKP